MVVSGRCVLRPQQRRDLGLCVTHQREQDDTEPTRRVARFLRGESGANRSQGQGLASGLGNRRPGTCRHDTEGLLADCSSVGCGSSPTPGAATRGEMRFLEDRLAPDQLCPVVVPRPLGNVSIASRRNRGSTRVEHLPQVSRRPLDGLGAGASARSAVEH